MGRRSRRTEAEKSGASPAMWFLRMLYRIAMPGGFFLLLATFLVRLRLFDEKASDPLFPYYSFIIFAGGLLLGAIFNRTRLFFSMVVLMLAESALLWVPVMRTPFTQHAVTASVALLLPLNLLFFGMAADRGIVSQSGRRRFALIGVQIAAVFIIAVPLRAHGGFLDYKFQMGEYAQLFTWNRVPQIGLITSLIAIIGLMIRLVVRYRPVESSLLWSAVAMFIAMQSGAASPVSVIYFACAGVILIVAIVETSYNMAYHDELTQLPSRRALNEALMKLGDSYTIAMLDVDHFKKFNDSYGHEAGDHALRMVASKLARVAGGGRAYRYGGEEFAVVFPSKPIEEAFTYLDRMRHLIERSTFVVRGPDRRGGKRKGPKRETNVTVSIGVASSNGEKTTPDLVMQAADQALYRAKARGRNCTVLARELKPAKAVSSDMRIISVS